MRSALFGVVSTVFVGFSGIGYCQEFTFGLDIDEVACDGEILGKPGEALQLNVTGFVEASVAGIVHWCQVIRGEGGSRSGTPNGPSFRGLPMPGLFG